MLKENIAAQHVSVKNMMNKYCTAYLLVSYVFQKILTIFIYEQKKKNAIITKIKNVESIISIRIFHSTNRK